MVSHMVKNLSAVQETRVQSVSQEGPLEKGMLPTPVFLPEEFHGQRSLTSQESDMTEQLTHTCNQSLVFLWVSY